MRSVSAAAPERVAYGGPPIQMDSGGRLVEQTTPPEREQRPRLKQKALHFGFVRFSRVDHFKAATPISRPCRPSRPSSKIVCTVLLVKEIRHTR